MCCIAEIAMTFWGIVTLVQGRFFLTRNKIVRGAWAYVIGGLLTATLPVVLGLGFVIGFVLTVVRGREPTVEELLPLSILDIVVVTAILSAVVVIAVMTGKPVGPKSTPTQSDVEPPIPPPVDTNNPYQSPSPPPDSPRNR
ncbi:MAG: hypothetical protein KatS3mg082_2895 [Nitrospiraceae bacterium]|nr:MAG: hypothetical protein KatS3mg082_2895 [Nitrospiraceae bacterium]